MTAATTSRSNATKELALFFWVNILGNEEADAWSSVVFKRQYQRHAKLAIADGADIEILKAALLLLKQDKDSGKIDRVYSIQQAIDWTKRGAGLSYYEVAEQQLKALESPPPVWDTFARQEWELRQKQKRGVGGRQICNTGKADNLSSAMASKAI